MSNVLAVLHIYIKMDMFILMLKKPKLILVNINVMQYV